MSKLKQNIAYSHGITAYKSGKSRIPARDNNLINDCIAGCQIGEGIPYCKAWLRAWDEMNAKEDTQ